MKALVTSVMTLCLLATSCRPGENAMTKEELMSTMKQVATTELRLIPVQCVDPAFQNLPDTFCYASKEPAEAWGARIDALPEFRNLTGWRDDYGVLSAALQYKDVGREVGVNYVRPNSFWELPKYDELKSHDAQGYVILTVTDDDPGTRE